MQPTAPIHTAGAVTGAIRPRRSLPRRIARWFAIALAILVTLVVLLLGVLQTSWGKSFVRRRVEAKLAAKVNGSVSLASIDYSFLFRHIELGGLEIRDAAGQPAIRVKSVAVDLDRGSLIAGTPVLDDLAVGGVAVDVVQRADGGSNLQGLFRPSTGAPLERITVRRFAVTGAATITKPDGTVIAVRQLALGGSVDARPATHGLDLALANLAAQVEIARPGATPRTLAVAVGAVTASRRATELAVDVKALVLGALAIDTLGVHLRTDGKTLQGDQAIALTGVRVDQRELTALLGKELLVSDVDIEAKVSGPPSALQITGAVRTGGATLGLAGTLDVSRPERPAYQLALTGEGLRSDLVHTDRPLPAVKTGLRIDVAGAGTVPDLDATVAVAVGPTTIGKLAIDGLTAKARARDGGFSLDALHVAAPGLAIDASGALGADRAVHGELAVKGEPARVAETLAAAGIAVPRRVPLPPELALRVTAAGDLDGEIAVELAPTRIAIARGAVSLTGSARIAHRVVTAAHTEVGLASLDLASLARLAGKRPKLGGTLSGRLELTGTPAAPRVSYALDLALRAPAVTVRVGGAAGPHAATAHVVAERRADRAVLAEIDAELPMTRVAGKPALATSGSWKVDVELARRSIAELVALAPTPVRAELPVGDVTAHIALAGTPARPTGTIDLAVTADKLPRGPQEVVVHGELTSTPRGMSLATSGTVRLAPGADPAVVLSGTIGLPPPLRHGHLDAIALRQGATLDLAVDLPEREVASLAYLKPALAKVGGRVGGHVAITGTPRAPHLDAALRLAGYTTASGAPGETTLTATGTPTALTAELHHAGAVAITAAIDRAVPDRIAIRTTAKADHAPLLALLPASVAGKLAGAEPGVVTWDMTGSFALVRRAGGLALDDAAVTGTLDIAGGAFAIPHTDRRWHDIRLAVRAEPTGLRIESLALHESDAEVADRTLSVTGELAWEKLRPGKLALALAAKDWLVFGTPTFGQADAPRATADFAIDVEADLTRPIGAIDATIRELALRAPDRLDRGHQPETVSVAGDVIFLGPNTGPAGTLPAVPVETEPAPRHRRPLDVHIHIPQAIRLQQTPFDVMAHGELAVTVRDEGVATRGTLTVDRGNLNLFGRDHALVGGTLAFTDEHPHGWMDLTFAHPLPNAVMRELSKASAAGGARVAFAGAPTKPKTALSGAGNAALVEVMALDNAGRPVYPSAPDLPASVAATAPRGDQLFVLTFMASNLPHLLFLDRMITWADPYDDGTAYGRIDHAIAERTRGRTRVRGVARPPTPGRSSAELQYDRLLFDDDRTVLGVGVRAGDRLGGGIGVFVEWSSDD